MQDLGSIFYQILDALIRILLPLAAGTLINYLVKRVGREKFLLAKDIIGSVVFTLEQQYRAGRIPKDDRLALAIERGIQKTGLTEEQVTQLIEEAVFVMNMQLRKYEYTQPDQAFKLNGESQSVGKPQNEATTPTLVTGEGAQGLTT